MLSVKLHEKGEQLPEYLGESCQQLKPRNDCTPSRDKCDAMTGPMDCFFACSSVHSSRMPAVTLLSSIPKFSSQEEHASAVNATPSSFSEIPPILNHQETNVLVTLEPPLEGYESAIQGTLYIITRYVYTSVFILWWKT